MFIVKKLAFSSFKHLFFVVVNFSFFGYLIFLNKIKIIFLFIYNECLFFFLLKKNLNRLHKKRDQQPDFFYV